jgi:hypothetical protein
LIVIFEYLEKPFFSQKLRLHRKLSSTYTSELRAAQARTRPAQPTDLMPQTHTTLRAAQEEAAPPHQQQIQTLFPATLIFNAIPTHQICTYSSSFLPILIKH